MIVSRETQDKLDLYLALLIKWSPKINLVSPASLKDAAKRHFQDSLQLSSLAPERVTSWVDMGSGGGFPGAVVAIVMKENYDAFSMTLIESDQRKAAFLRTVSRETQTPFQVIAQRVEDVAPQNADVISARALASLSELCQFTERHMAAGGTALFPKGETWGQEVEDAQKQWRFTFKAHKSVTNDRAAILEIGGLSRA